MPIDNKMYALIAIEGNPLLQRYMSLEKLVSMLHRNSLFFTRIDRLEDSIEGTSPKIVRKSLKRFYTHLNRIGYFNEPMTDEIMENSINNDEANTEKMRALFTVNCWHKRDTENALMWMAYSAINSGIMIKTTYSKLVNSLKDSSESVQSSQVVYADYENDEKIQFGNAYYPVVYKRHFFSDENEIRLIHMVSQEKWEHDWENEESNAGKYIKVNTNELIDEIRVAPLAPDWYLEVVTSVCERYGVKTSVLRSALA